VRSLTLISLLALAAPGALATDGFRQLDSHSHGHGTLNIAIEGKLVEMELDIPGADIVGFEHRAESAEDKAAIDRAKAKLQNGAALFVLSPEAGCEQERTSVRLIAEEDEHDDKHDHGPGSKETDTDGDGHAEFRALFRFGCAAPDRIVEIKFPFFHVFPNSQELQVQMITSRRTYGFDVERGTPVLKLADQN